MIPWALLLLGACSVLEARRTPAADATWPHPSDYGKGSVHGLDSLSPDATCDACHGGRAPAGPTCTTCHATYPHPPGWRSGDAHGEDRSPKVGSTQERDPDPLSKRTSCLVCHGDTRLAAGMGWSCTSCHAGYPHPSGWLSTGLHGEAALARKDRDLSCGTCHSVPGEKVDPWCQSCHAGFPHPEGWDEGSVHGAAWISDGAGCQGCHGQDGTGGSAGVSCARCHAAYPHGDDYPDGHKAAAGQSGEATCLTCHDAGEGPSSVPLSCSPACHGGGL